jgi:hypothetical protein
MKNMLAPSSKLDGSATQPPESSRARHAAFALHRSRDTLHLISPSLPAEQQTCEETLEKYLEEVQVKSNKAVNLTTVFSLISASISTR